MDSIHLIVNKLYSTLPLVPTGNILQNIYQDIQYGLYDNCGDPNKNWEKWKERCRELLKQRNILSDNNYSRLRKTAQHDTDNRSCAIAFINGEFYEGETHSIILQEYMQNNDIEILTRDYDHCRDSLEKELNDNNNLFNLSFACMSKISANDYDELLSYYIDYEYGEDYFEENTNEHVSQNAIFIELDTVSNLDVNLLIKEIKNKYPDYHIYEEDYHEPFDFKEFKKIASNKIMNKLSYHDSDNRTAAMIFINGEFYKDQSHNQALTQYFESIRKHRSYNKDSESREVFEYEVNEFNSINQIACLNVDDDNIFIEKDTLIGISINELANIVKQHYPNCSVYEESDYFIDIDDYKKIANVKLANNNLFTWEEVYNETINSGGKIYCEPLGSDTYFRENFELRFVNLGDISGYMTYEEYEEYDLDEDCSIVEYLFERYDSGEDLPPIILDRNNKIIDGSHRASMYNYMGIETIKAYVQVV